MDEQNGIIINIQKFCINDGPGIRTTVFFKGCPLNCLWCHNPESKDSHIEIAYYPKKCINCGNCISECTFGCHKYKDGKHIYNRQNCMRCALCVKNCYSNALEVIGKEVTVKEVMDEVLKDRIFYNNSGGGITLSGGEPMMQFPFAFALLREAKAKGLHTCMETTGFAPTINYTKLLGTVDLFLYDYKETNPVLHKKYTGFTNELILNNLFHIDRLGGKTILRVPIIPGYNDRSEHFMGVAEVANSLKNILEINIEPYHPLGKSKCDKIGKKYPIEDLPFPNDETVERWINEIQSRTDIMVKRG